MALEELLNKLIEKGWKPMGHKPLTDEIKKKVKVERYNRKPMAIVIKNGRKYADDYYSLREIVSINSGLWQFVCENKLTIVKHPNKNKYPRDKLEREEHRDWTREQGYYGEPVKQNKWYNWDTAEYRLIESALTDESELEEFLLENIKVE